MFENLTLVEIVLIISMASIYMVIISLISNKIIDPRVNKNKYKFCLKGSRNDAIFMCVTGIIMLIFGRYVSNVYVKDSLTLGSLLSLLCGGLLVISMVV